MAWHDDDWFRDLENLRGARPPKAVDLPPPPRRDWAAAEGYRPDPGLADALRVALLLRKPLLLTGEPGTGKTECAGYLAWKLGLGAPLVFDAKSTSQARDLFYTYDTLGRLHDKGEPLHYLRLSAAGEAILQAHATAPFTPPDYVHHGPATSVVLIDEIDKAPRDFPNDLLNELDRMFFRIPELMNRRVDTPPGREPVLVITSNSEKNLPPAFLRRCVYYHIPFPEPEALEKIVAARIAKLPAGSVLLREALEFFGHLRDEDTGLAKAPATAELLDWLMYLVTAGADLQLSLKKQEKLVSKSLVTLLKNQQDQANREQLWSEWARPGDRPGGRSY